MGVLGSWLEWGYRKMRDVLESIAMMVLGRARSRRRRRIEQCDEHRAMVYHQDSASNVSA
jgi:hypothetical protein